MTLREPLTEAEFERIAADPRERSRDAVVRLITELRDARVEVSRLLSVLAEAQEQMLTAHNASDMAYRIISRSLR